MPITQGLILYVPTWILGALVVGGVALLSVAGLFVVRPFLPHHTKLRAHHDVAGPILGVMGVLYAVLLAFVMVNVWQNMDRTKANVETEANYLADIFRDSEAFTPEFRQPVAKLVNEYRQAVIDEEWKTMAKGKMSPKVESVMNRIWGLYTAYEPKSPKEQSFFDESVRKLNSFRELRRQRLMDSQAGLHPLLWFVLIAGMVTTISLTFLFGMEDLKAHIVMIALLAMSIALILFTIMLLDFPFTGDISISSEPFRQLILS
ncbi:MAG: DUF4239 domain-containing protein [Candidatus Omnitrophota bacterium]